MGTKTVLLVGYGVRVRCRCMCTGCGEVWEVETDSLTVGVDAERELWRLFHKQQGEHACGQRLLFPVVA